MAKLITISLVGSTTIVKEVIDGGTPIFYPSNTNRNYIPVDDGIKILPNPEEATLNNYVIKIAELTNDGIDFAGIVTVEDFINKLAQEKCFKNGGGLGVDEITQLILSQQTNISGSLFIGNYWLQENYSYYISVDKNTMIAGELIGSNFGNTVTLDPAHDTFDRYDILVVNNNKTVGFIKGDPSINPDIIEVDSDTQVRVAVIRVTANTTTQVGVNTIAAYKENNQIIGGEFDTLTTVNVNANAVDKFDTGAKSIKFTTAQTSDKITLTNNNTLDGKNFSNLIFKILVEGNTPHRLALYLLNASGTKVANTLLNNGVFGLDTSNKTTWQTIIIPAWAFVGIQSNLYEAIQIQCDSAGSTLYIDEVYIQEGTSAINEETALSIKEKYESNHNTNNFTDAYKDKLNSITPNVILNTEKQWFKGVGNTEPLIHEAGDSVMGYVEGEFVYDAIYLVTGTNIELKTSYDIRGQR